MRRYTKAMVNLLLALGLFLAFVFLFPKLLIFFSPFVVGWIIALIAAPLVRFFEEKVRIKRKIGSAFVIIVVIATVVLLIYVIGAWLIQQVIGLVEALPNMWTGLENDLNSILSSLGHFVEKLPLKFRFNLDDFAGQVGNYLGEFFEKLSTPTIEAAGNLAKQLPTVFIGLIMALLSSYFFVAEREGINEWCRKYMPVTLQMRYRTIRQSLVKSVGGYFKAQLKIEIWMYLLLVIGLGILRVEYFALIAIGIAFLDFLPFFGTGTVLLPWAVIRLFTEDYKMAIGLLIIWGGGQLARQLIQPKIVGDSMGVPPLPTLVLLYVGYKLGGVFGMIVAVPIGLLFASMYQEGAFETTQNSMLILLAGFNRFRQIAKEDLFEVEAMALENEEKSKKLDEQRRLAEQKKKEKKKRH